MSEYDEGPEWGWCPTKGCKEPADPVWYSGGYPDEPDLLLCYKHIGAHVAELRRALEGTRQLLDNINHRTFQNGVIANYDRDIAAIDAILGLTRAGAGEGVKPMLHLNADTLNKVIAQARADVSAQPDAAKWEAAITRAVKLLEENPWIERTDDGLLIAGSEGTYSANGSCQCPAYRAGMTHCKHRVLAKLVKRYDEAERARVSYEQALTDVCELFAS